MKIRDGSALQRGKSRNGAKLAALSGLLLAALFLSFFLGRYSLNPVEVLRLVGERIFGVASGLTNNEANVFFNLRLPRVLAAVAVGCGLSLSGCVYQSTFRNPMVSPDILGATYGAGLGAALALLWDFNSIGVQLMAFVFGLLAVGGTYLMANIFGAGNSATIFSLKAMELLDIENEHSIYASNEMCMFVSLTMSMVQLVPVTVIKVRSDLGSASPEDIIIPSIIAGVASMIISVWICKLYERKKCYV